MKLAVIGIGNLGSQIAHTLLLRSEGNLIYLYEPHPGSRTRAKAEWGDLYPVAKATGNKLIWAKLPPKADIYIVTAGKPRPPTATDKKKWMKEAFATNLGIVMGSIEGCLQDAHYFIATNPPKEIAKKLVEMGYKAHELRRCTDTLRRRNVPNGYSAKYLNNLVIGGKGHTAFTPAFAIVEEVMGAMG